MITSQDEIQVGDTVAINPAMPGKRRVIVRITHIAPPNQYAPEYDSFLGYRVRPNDLSVSFGYEHSHGARFPYLEILRKG